jgi:hypothetical protein
MISNVIHNPPTREEEEEYDKYKERTRHRDGRKKQQFKYRKYDGGPPTDRSKRSNSRKMRAIELRAEQDEKADFKSLQKDQLTDEDENEDENDDEYHIFSTLNSLYD